MGKLFDIAEVHKVYFIGIGGIGMSALARFFRSRGVEVLGYDRTPTPLTETLTKEGISVQYSDDPQTCPRDVDFVVYTPAIPADSLILAAYKQWQVPILKRSDALQVITQDTRNICIAGTHGKTTISTMVAHVLRDSGFGCNAFLGGIAVNYGTNFWSDPNGCCVVEADEYDRSFLKLNPEIISISSMDPDHLDIYGTAEEMEQAFLQFAGMIKQQGLLITHFNLKRKEEMQAGHRISYHLREAAADVHCSSLEVVDGSYHYTVKAKDWQINDITLNMGGLHNVENSLVAIAIAKHLGIADEKIKSALGSFKGVKRRFEYIIRSSSQVFIDDYAHHPEELRALITGVRSLYPGRKCTLVFQPHLYTRTRDLAAGFARSLDMADEVILLPIYPARELPIAGVESQLIAAGMKGKVVLMEKEELLAHIRTSRPGLLLTAGAGDIDKMVEPIKNILTNVA